MLSAMIARIDTRKEMPHAYKQYNKNLFLCSRAFVEVLPRETLRRRYKLSLLYISHSLRLRINQLRRILLRAM